MLCNCSGLFFVNVICQRSKCHFYMKLLPRYFSHLLCCCSHWKSPQRGQIHPFWGWIDALLLDCCRYLCGWHKGSPSLTEWAQKTSSHWVSLILNAFFKGYTCDVCGLVITPLRQYFLAWKYFVTFLHFITEWIFKIFHQTLNSWRMTYKKAFFNVTETHYVNSLMRKQINCQPFGGNIKIKEKTLRGRQRGKLFLSVSVA